MMADKNTNKRKDAPATQNRGQPEKKAKTEDDAKKSNKAVPNYMRALSIDVYVLAAQTIRDAKGKNAPKPQIVTLRKYPVKPADMPRAAIFLMTVLNFLGFNEAAKLWEVMLDERDDAYIQFSYEQIGRLNTQLKGRLQQMWDQSAAKIKDEKQAMKELDENMRKHKDVLMYLNSKMTVSTILDEVAQGMWKLCLEEPAPVLQWCWANTAQHPEVHMMHQVLAPLGNTYNIEMWAKWGLEGALSFHRAVVIINWDFVRRATTNQSPQFTSGFDLAEAREIIDNRPVIFKGWNTPYSPTGPAAQMDWSIVEANKYIDRTSQNHKDVMEDVRFLQGVLAVLQKTVTAAVAAAVAGNDRLLTIPSLSALQNSLHRKLQLAPLSQPLRMLPLKAMRFGKFTNELQKNALKVQSWIRNFGKEMPQMDTEECVMPMEELKADSGSSQLINWDRNYLEFTQSGWFTVVELAGMSTRNQHFYVFSGSIFACSQTRTLRLPFFIGGENKKEMDLDDERRWKPLNPENATQLYRQNAAGAALVWSRDTDSRYLMSFYLPPRSDNSETGLHLVPTRMDVLLRLQFQSLGGQQHAALPFLIETYDANPEAANAMIYARMQEQGWQIDYRVREFLDNVVRCFPVGVLAKPTVHLSGLPAKQVNAMVANLALIPDAEMQGQANEIVRKMLLRQFDPAEHIPKKFAALGYLFQALSQEKLQGSFTDLMTTAKARAAFDARADQMMMLDMDIGAVGLAQQLLKMDEQKEKDIKMEDNTQKEMKLLTRQIKEAATQLQILELQSKALQKRREELQLSSKNASKELEGVEAKSQRNTDDIKKKTDKLAALKKRMAETTKKSEEVKEMVELEGKNQEKMWAVNVATEEKSQIDKHLRAWNKRLQEIKEEMAAGMDEKAQSALITEQSTLEALVKQGNASSAEKQQAIESMEKGLDAQTKADLEKEKKKKGESGNKKYKFIEAGAPEETEEEEEEEQEEEAGFEPELELESTPRDAFVLPTTPQRDQIEPATPDMQQMIDVVATIFGEQKNALWKETKANEHKAADQVLQKELFWSRVSELMILCQFSFANSGDAVVLRKLEKFQLESKTAMSDGKEAKASATGEFAVFQILSTMGVVLSTNDVDEMKHKIGVFQADMLKLQPFNIVMSVRDWWPKLQAYFKEATGGDIDADNFFKHTEKVKVKKEREEKELRMATFIWMYAMHVQTIKDALQLVVSRQQQISRRDIILRHIALADRLCHFEDAFFLRVWSGAFTAHLRLGLLVLTARDVVDWPTSFDQMLKISPGASSLINFYLSFPTKVSDAAKETKQMKDEFLALVRQRVLHLSVWVPESEQPSRGFSYENARLGDVLIPELYGSYAPIQGLAQAGFIETITMAASLQNGTYLEQEMDLLRSEHVPDWSANEMTIFDAPLARCSFWLPHLVALRDIDDVLWRHINLLLLEPDKFAQKEELADFIRRVIEQRNRLKDAVREWAFVPRSNRKPFYEAAKRAFREVRKEIVQIELDLVVKLLRKDKERLNQSRIGFIVSEVAELEDESTSLRLPFTFTPEQMRNYQSTPEDDLGGERANPWILFYVNRAEHLRQLAKMFIKLTKPVDEGRARKGAYGGVWDMAPLADLQNARLPREGLVEEGQGDAVKNLRRILATRHKVLRQAKESKVRQDDEETESEDEGRAERRAKSNVRKKRIKEAEEEEEQEQSEDEEGDEATAMEHQGQADMDTKGRATVADDDEVQNVNRALHNLLLRNPS